MWWLALVFVVVPAAELAILIQVGTQIGVLATLGLVVLTAVIGAHLARLQGLDVMRRFQRSMAEGRVPADALMDGAFLLAAGAFLMTPGFVTDAFGFICLIPPARAGLKRWLARRLKGRIEIRTYGTGPDPFDPRFGPPGAPRGPRPGTPDDVLDVEPPSEDSSRRAS